MKSISDEKGIQNIDLQRTIVIGPRHRTERDYIISKFLHEINIERIGTKYKQLSFIALKMKLKKITNIHDLYILHSECVDFKNRYGTFGAKFFSALKPKTP